MPTPSVEIPRTISYMIGSTTGEPNDVCDRLLAGAKACGYTVEQSGVDAAKGFIRIRTTDDDAARDYASQIAAEAGVTDYILETGYGFHRRSVEV